MDFCYIPAIASDLTLAFSLLKIISLKLTTAAYMEEKSPAHQLVHHHQHHPHHHAAAQLQQLELRGDTAITNSEEQDMKPPPGLQVG